MRIIKCIIIKIDREKFLTNEVSFVNYIENLGYKVMRGVKALRTKKKKLAIKLGITKVRKNIPDFYFYLEDKIGKIQDEFFCEIKGNNDVFRGGQIEMLNKFSDEIQTIIGLIYIKQKNAHKEKEGITSIKTIERGEK